MIALTATTAALALSACSPSSPANEAETANTAQGASVLLPEGEGSTQYPLTLETPFGHTVLDKCPERVAVVSAVGVDTESLLALDAVQVFAVAKYDGEDPWLPKDLWEQVEFTEQGDAGEEISAEAIAASEPDLIVKLQAYETFDQDRFNQLSRVAPVLYTDAEQPTWQDVLTSLGETQDLRDAAASKIADPTTGLRQSKPTTRTLRARPSRWSMFIAANMAPHMRPCQKQIPQLSLKALVSSCQKMPMNSPRMAMSKLAMRWSGLSMPT